MYKGLTRDIAEEALDILAPTIGTFIQAKHRGAETRKVLHVVILKPGTKELLTELTFGLRRPFWKAEYDVIAMGKAQVCFRTGMTGSVMLREAPWLLLPGDCRYPGAVTENGLIIAASGQKAHFDEMFSWMILSAIQGLMLDEIAIIPADAPAFLPVA